MVSKRFATGCNNHDDILDYAATMVKLQADHTAKSEVEKE
jgi:hypothetical protein